MILWIAVFFNNEYIFSPDNYIYYIDFTHLDCTKSCGKLSEIDSSSSCLEFVTLVFGFVYFLQFLGNFILLFFSGTFEDFIWSEEHDSSSSVILTLGLFSFIFLFKKFSFKGFFLFRCSANIDLSNELDDSDELFMFSNSWVFLWSSSKLFCLPSILFWLKFCLLYTLDGDLIWNCILF